MKTKEGKELLDFFSNNQITSSYVIEDENLLEAYQDGFYECYFHVFSLINKAMNNGSELYWQSFLEDLVTVLSNLQENNILPKSEKLS